MKKTLVLLLIIILSVFCACDKSNDTICKECGISIEKDTILCDFCQKASLSNTEVINSTNNNNNNNNTSSEQQIFSEQFVIDSLKKVPGILEIQAVTEETDPNNKLNKPNSYISHIYFSYGLLNQKDFIGETLIEKGTISGGSIEIYKTKEDAESRNEYLASFDGTPLCSGSHKVFKTCIIRTSDDLTKSQQELLENNIIAALKSQIDKIVDVRVQYKVNYFLENLNNEFVLEKQVVYKEFPEVKVQPQIETFDNFSLDINKSNLSCVVKSDGTSTLDVYFKRDKYSIFCNTLGGEIISSTICYYEQDILLKAKVTQLGYEFDGWYSNGILLSNQENYQCKVNGHIEAKFKVLPEMTIFEFESTATTCKILDIKDNKIETLVIPEYVTELPICNLSFQNLKILKINAKKLKDISFPDESSWIFSNSSSQNIEVVIGKSVTYIPANLFYNSNNINVEKLIFENDSSCETIGRCAFFGLDTLEFVDFGNNSNLKTISAFAFADCKNIKTINFGTNSILETIEHDVFQSDKLTEVRIPKSVKNIETWAFYISSNAVKLKIYCEISKNNKPTGWSQEWYGCYYPNNVEVIWEIS